MEIKLEELAALICPQPAVKSASCSTIGHNLGQNIVVLDRGFVYVGDVSRDGDWLRITNAKNIRYWGTKNGLGELRDGPKAETKLDLVGEVLAPMRAVIHLVPCKGF